MITRQQLNDYYQALLRPETYADYCPNGLQIEGAEQIEPYRLCRFRNPRLHQSGCRKQGRRPGRSSRPVLDVSWRQTIDRRLCQTDFPAGKKRHQPVRLSPAAGRAPGNRQCRDSRPADWLQATTALRRLQRLGNRH